MRDVMAEPTRGSQLMTLILSIEYIAKEAFGSLLYLQEIDCVHGTRDRTVARSLSPCVTTVPGTYCMYVLSSQVSRERGCSCAAGSDVSHSGTRAIQSVAEHTHFGFQVNDERVLYSLILLVQDRRGEGET